MTLRICYGGTFDPVHLGHLTVAQAVRDALGAEVALLPAADPPHKQATHADARQRACMLDLAVAGERGLVVDRRELSRDGPSYTVDTLLALRKELGLHVPLVWMIGGDSLLQLDRWHRWRELFAHAHILAVARPGSPLDAATIAQRAPLVAAEIAPRRHAASALQRMPAGGFAVFDMPEPRPESSTELRRRIAAGEPWRHWVPAAVAEYIDRHGLYASRGAVSAPL